MMNNIDKPIDSSTKYQQVQQQTSTPVRPLNLNNYDLMNSTPIKKMAMLSLCEYDFILFDYDPKLEDFVTKTDSKQPFENNKKRNRDILKSLLKQTKPKLSSRFNLQEYCQAQSQAAKSIQCSKPNLCVIKIKKNQEKK